MTSSIRVPKLLVTSGIRCATSFSASKLRPRMVLPLRVVRRRPRRANARPVRRIVYPVEAILWKRTYADSNIADDDEEAATPSKKKTPKKAKNQSGSEEDDDEEKTKKDSVVKSEPGREENDDDGLDLI